MFQTTAMWARILKLSTLMILGLLIAGMVGYPTMGTLAIYSCLIHMYATSLKSSRALLKKRLLMILTNIPFTVAVRLALGMIPALPVLVCNLLTTALCVPLMYSINHKFKLGFSEISQMVNVIIVTLAFPNTLPYALARMSFVTLGLVVSYFTYACVLPLRHDKMYEKAKEELRLCLPKLVSRVLDGLPTSEEYPPCLKLHAEIGQHLSVLQEDVEIKRQYRAYQGRMEHLLNEYQMEGFLLELLELLQCQKSHCLSEECRYYVSKELRKAWSRFPELYRCAAGPSGGEPQWNSEYLSFIQSREDLHAIGLLVDLKNQMNSICITA